MTFAEMIEGLQIFAKYEEHGLEAHLNGADHDVIWATTPQMDYDHPDYDEPEVQRYLDKRMSEDDLVRLEELGWFISHEYGNVWTHYC